MITLEELKSNYFYDPLVGNFIRITKRGIKCNIGDIAGTTDKDGYVIISFNKKLYRAHRLAWLYVYGVWPVYELDHKNRIRNDNRINNLREATRSQNLCNRPTQKNNIIGQKGIYFDKKRKKYRVKIILNKKDTHGGYFLLLEDAILKRDKIYLEIHKTFSNFD